MRFVRDERNWGENVSINARKIYDSCASKDYLENLRCFFLESQQNVVDQALSVKVKNVNVINAQIDIENSQFREGLFSISQTFFFKVQIEALSSGISNSLNALCLFSKNMSLLGGKSDVKTFYYGLNPINDKEEIFPSVVVQVSKPIVLCSSLNDVVYSSEIEKIPNIPDEILNYFGGKFAYLNISKYVSLSLGLFSITHLERDIQIVTPTGNIQGPLKQCNSGVNAQDAFNQIKFPVGDFFPSN